MRAYHSMSYAKVPMQASKQASEAATGGATYCSTEQCLFDNERNSVLHFDSNWFQSHFIDRTAAARKTRQDSLDPPVLSLNYRKTQN